MTWLLNQALRHGVIATLPTWMREMGDVSQPRIVDALVRPVLWTAFRVLRTSKHAQLALLGQVSPGTVPVVAPVLLDIPPRHPEVTTPAAARERFGYDTACPPRLA